MKKISKTCGKEEKNRRTGENHNTAPSLGQISLDLSVYQNPISELYVNPSRHHCVPWLTDPQFPQHLVALQSTLPSQSLTTKGLAYPQKGNSSLLSLLLCPVTGSGLSLILIGDSLVPASMSIRFSGVPGMGTGRGGGNGDWNGGRTGKGSGETCLAHPLWFFWKCICSCHDFFIVRTSLNNIVAFAFCFHISCSIRRIVEWRWLMVSIFWKAIHLSKSPMSSLKFSQESRIVSSDSRFRFC